MATLTEGLPLSLEDRFEGALKTARSTFQTGRTRALQWRIAQLNALKSMLDEHECAFYSALYRDLGKSHFEASYIELDNVKNSCDFFIKNLKKLVKPKSVDVPWYMKRSTRAKVVAEPLGVVLIFSAWNYPLLLALDPLVAAIAAGNAVILKPAECAKSMCLILKQLLPQYLDAQAVQIFCIASPRIGCIIMEAAAKHLTPVTLELGGKSPAIIDSTAEIYCRPLTRCTRYAPYIFNQESLDRLQTVLDEVKDSIVFSLGETHKENLVMVPTILLDPPIESRIMQEELFGPILPVLQVHSMEEALNFVCSRPQPLAVYMFTTNMELANEVVEKTSSGSVVINDMGAQFSLQSIPFGAVGESGMGSYHGRYGFDTFSHLKGVVTIEASRDDPIRYPPYTAKNKAILRACLRNRSMLDVILIKLGLKTF
ncbi:hypothetical protein KP509_13G027300 [Ceratopteris richardii]|uniref:Aldehyde dehydrogenase n=1 Tax=Ceratopteris richardii TaxID=49495 RepID=A0A8T2THJ1_CERRI|nr:hypothetical protein KP509_13G027300 [Ceratopteris richardii]